MDVYRSLLAWASSITIWENGEERGRAMVRWSMQEIRHVAGRLARISHQG